METSEQPRGIRKGLRNTKIKILSSKIHRVAGLPNRSAGHGWKRSGGGNEARARGGGVSGNKDHPWRERGRFVKIYEDEWTGAPRWPGRLSV